MKSSSVSKRQPKYSAANPRGFRYYQLPPQSVKSECQCACHTGYGLPLPCEHCERPPQSDKSKPYTRNWTCKKHNTFGDDVRIGCAYCGYSGRGRIGKDKYTLDSVKSKKLDTLGSSFGHEDIVSNSGKKWESILKMGIVDEDEGTITF